MNIGIFYGSTTGNTTRAAEALKAQLGSFGDVDLHDIATADPAAMSGYDLVVLGTSTWGMGDMQDDWVGKTSLPGADLAGKHAAVFGLGDQMSFPDTFVDAMAVLADNAEKAGAKLVGRRPADGYECSGSAALRDGQFVGLPLDEDNQSDLTESRIAEWAQQIQKEVSG
jgi:flavodoxin I